MDDLPARYDVAADTYDETRGGDARAAAVAREVSTVWLLHLLPLAQADVVPVATVDKDLAHGTTRWAQTGSGGGSRRSDALRRVAA